MAVWSKTTLVDTLMNRRIDSEFFRPSHFEAEQKIRKCNTEKLSRIGLFIPGPFGSAFHVKNYDVQSCYRYLRGRDIKPFFIKDDDNRYLPENDFKRLQHYEIQPNDLMISVVGTLGNVAVCTPNETPAIFSCKSTLFRSQEIDPYYLLAFLNCNQGQLCLLRRQRGAVQTGLNIEDLKTIPIPRFGNKIETEIASNLRMAYESICDSKEHYIQAQHLLESEIGLDKLKSKKPVGYTARFSTVGLSDAFNAGRIDAQCFAPDAIFYEKWLNDHAQCEHLIHLLQTMTKGRQQLENFTGSTDYCSIKHISGHELTDVVKCQPSPDTPLATQNDLLLAITGATIGKIGIVKRYMQLAFSGDLLCLKTNSEIDPHYLLVALDHAVGQVQFNRWITGSTNGHLSPRDVGRILVPRLKKETEKHIAKLVEKSLSKRIESERLLDQAKSRVEQLIEEAAVR